MRCFCARRMRMPGSRRSTPPLPPRHAVCARSIRVPITRPTGSRCQRPQCRAKRLTAPYRGAGRPEAIYLIEQAIEDAARELDIDPIELRRRNIISPAAMPYQTALGPNYDCGDFTKNVETALMAADYAAVPCGVAVCGAASIATTSWRALFWASSTWRCPRSISTH